MRMLIAAAALVLLFPLTASAAVQYEFTQKNTTDDAVAPTTDLIARATIEGARSKVEFIGGTVYPPGTYLISDGGTALTFVDPTRRWYTTWDTVNVSSALGASNIKIENLTSKLDKRGSGVTVAGLPTEQYRLTMAYDITVTRKGIPLRQHVQTEIESWVTQKYGDLLRSPFASISSTGNAEIDKLLEAGTNKISGFPLRQTVRTRTSFQGLRSGKSELKVPQTRTIVREMAVTSIREIAAEAALFTVPAEYRRADAPDLPKTATQVLTFDPPPVK